MDITGTGLNVSSAAFGMFTDGATPYPGFGTENVSHYSPSQGADDPVDIRPGFTYSPGIGTTNFSIGFNETDQENATGPRLKPVIQLTTPYRIISCFFYSVIFLVGFVGNVMVVIVVSKIRVMRTPTNCYLVSLGVADILVLVSACLPQVFATGVPSLRMDEWILGHVTCSILIFLNYLGVNVSSLSITAFTIERYIAICHPMKAQTICTVKRAKRIIVVLWTFGICYNAPWLALTTIVTYNLVDGTTQDSCTFKLTRGFYIWVYMADFMLFYAIPLILTCVLYGLIGRILFSSTIPKTPGKSNGTNSETKKSSVQTSRVQVIKMLAIVVGLFAILWLPYRAWVVFNSFSSRPYHDMWFRLLCRMMVFMNSAINPILYNAMSVKFRRAFKRLLTCGKY
ncbi:thyrotropin-releasing hormone receptor-like [Lineus longissimus]|uniref:thyrotropin-releasing hormone receptor-like n=1 Tax=Lineus longissimus TaxID=88925 RepID=UPI00315D8A8F